MGLGRSVVSGPVIVRIPALTKRFIGLPSSPRLPPLGAATLVGRCAFGRIRKSRGHDHGGREANGTRLHHRGGDGAGPGEAAEPLRLRATGLEGPFQELRETARIGPPDRMAAGT